MNKARVRGDESKMFCARLKETIRAREEFIARHGTKALVEAARVLGIIK